MVECTLFDSRDCLENADWMWEHWEEEFEDEPKPEEKPEEMLMRRAWDFLMDEHYNLVWELKEHEPGRLILYGTLGLWTGHHSGYKMVENDNALDYMKDDYELKIAYEDGDIFTYHYHHDGTNCLTLYELREFDSSDLIGMTSDDVHKLADVYSSLNSEWCLDDDEWEWLDLILLPTAKYFKAYFSRDALDDLAKREAAHIDLWKPRLFEPLVVEAPTEPDEVMTMQEADKEFNHWWMRNQDGHVYCYEPVYIEGDGSYDLAYQMDKDHEWRCIGSWWDFKSDHKDDKFTYYEEEE